MAKRHKKVKLSKIEKLARDIARWEAKQHSAKEMLVRSTVELKALYKKRTRARHTAPVIEHIGNGVVAIPTEHFDKAVAVPAEAFEAGVRFGPDEAVKRPQDVAPPKPKRPRKAPPGSERAALHHTPPSAKRTPAPRGSVALASKDFAGDLAIAARESAEDQGESRAARMEAMGFRKTPRRGK